MTAGSETALSCCRTTPSFGARPTRPRLAADRRVLVARVGLRRHVDVARYRQLRADFGSHQELQPRDNVRRHRTNVAQHARSPIRTRDTGGAPHTWGLRWRRSGGPTGAERLAYTAAMGAIALSTRGIKREDIPSTMP